MNFIDRTSLGDTLAGKLERFRGKDAIIICLQESSLLTCLTIASQIRAWVYPLISAPVYSHDHSRVLLGAFDYEGTFCAVPRPAASPVGLPADKAAEKKAKAALDAAIKKQRPAAMKAIQKEADSYGIELDKHRMDGRDVILVADVLTSTLPLALARQLLADVTPSNLTAVIGNATQDVAQLVRTSAAETEILDVMSGIYYDEDHYFEHADSYTPEQKHTLTQHIAAYWQ